MEEEWKIIEEFPNYSVTNHGEVFKDHTSRDPGSGRMQHFGRELKQTNNQQGIPSVGMVTGGRQYRRAVAPLVARAFLPPISEPFDTPINLDGDRENNRVENLMWRPRWFAILYHQQFTKVDPKILNMPVYVVTTDETFERTIDCCMKYGLLAKRVVLAAHNNERVFPAKFVFGLVDV